MNKSPLSNIVPVIFGGLILGLLIGGSIYYIRIQNSYDHEAQSVIKQYDTRLQNEQEIKASLLDRTNELEQKVQELQSKVLDLDQEGISKICIGSHNKEFISLEDIRSTMNKMDLSDRIMNAYFANSTLNDIIALNTTTDFILCQFAKEEIAFVYYGTYDSNNNVIGYFKDAPNNDDYMLSYSFEFNEPSGDIGMCYLQGVVEGFLTDHLLYSCGGGDGPYAWQKVYAFNISTGQNTLIKDCVLESEELTCDVNVLSP